MRVLICIYTAKGPKKKFLAYAQLFHIFDENGCLVSNDELWYLKLRAYHKDIDHYGNTQPLSDIISELVRDKSCHFSKKQLPSDELGLGNSLYLTIGHTNPSVNTIKEININTLYDWVVCEDHDAGNNPSEIMYTYLPKHSSSKNPGKESIDRIMKISNYLPTRILEEEDIMSIRMHSDYVWKHCKNPLHVLLKAYAFREGDIDDSLMSYLKEFDPPEDIYASLDLLTSGYLGFREFVLEKCFADISEEELLMYLLEIVQCVRSDVQDDQSVLLNFLIKRSCASFIIAHNVYWHMKAEKDLDERLKEFIAAIPKATKDRIEDQEKLLSRISQFYQSRRSKPPIPKDLQDINLVPLPLDPTLKILGIKPEYSVFSKSNSAPILFDLKCEDFPSYKLIYKEGDDLRKDQFVVQLIKLMDFVLKKENLDLCIKTYKVIALTDKYGMVEFVNNAKPLKDLNIVYFLDESNPDLAERRKAYDRFLRSCAGYCAFTYILGVGDRNLDNLMVTNKGYFFHIDFGYIFGEEPHALRQIASSKVKLSSYMVEALGKDYDKFIDLTRSAFDKIKNASKLIIVLAKLMLKEGAIKYLEKTLSTDTTEYIADIEASKNSSADAYIEKLHSTAKMFKN